MYAIEGDGGALERQVGKGLLGGAGGEVGAVVLLREMAEPEAAEDFGVDVLAEEGGALRIAEMAKAAADALLERERIGARGQHIGVVVGLYDEILGAGHVAGDFRRDGADVGDEAERRVAAGDEVARVVGRIVGHGERLDEEGAEREGSAVGDDADVLLGNLIANDGVAVDAGEDLLRGIDGPVELAAEVAGGADVVEVVVGEEGRLDVGQLTTVGAEILEETADAYAEVDENGVVGIAQVIAVAAGTGTEGKKVKR